MTDEQRVDRVGGVGDSVHVTRHREDVVGRPAFRRAVPAQIDGDDLEVFGEWRDERVPHRVGVRDPVHEDQGRARAGCLIGDGCAVGCARGRHAGDATESRADVRPAAS